MRVLVFRDIKNKRWTLYSVDMKQHLGYRTRLFLTDCFFLVDASKHKEILESGNRKPCAWVVGSIASCQGTSSMVNSVYFWPLKKEDFFVEENGRRVDRSKAVFFNSKGQCLK